MFTFDRIDARRIAISTLGALALSVTCVMGAVAPAKAATPATAPAWAALVQSRMSTVRVDDPRFAPATVRQADVALHFAPDGAFRGASLARSSGSALLDAHAVKVANRLAYPPLPADMRGGAQAVTMQVTFGDGIDAVATPAPAKRIQMAAARGKAIQVAAR